MTRNRINVAIKSLEEHAETADEMHLINYLKMNLSNLWLLEDDTDTNKEPEENPEYRVKCSDCGVYCKPEDLIPYKYEPALEMCEGCIEERMIDE